MWNFVFLVKVSGFTVTRNSFFLYCIGTLLFSLFLSWRKKCNFLMVSLLCPHILNLICTYIHSKNINQLSRRRFLKYVHLFIVNLFRMWLIFGSFVGWTVQRTWSNIRFIIFFRSFVTTSAPSGHCNQWTERRWQGCGYQGNSCYMLLFMIWFFKLY